MSAKDKAESALINLGLCKKDIEKLAPIAKLSGNKQLAKRLQEILDVLNQTKNQRDETQLVFDGMEYKLDPEE